MVFRFWNNHNSDMVHKMIKVDEILCHLCGGPMKWGGLDEPQWENCISCEKCGLELSVGWQTHHANYAKFFGGGVLRERLTQIAKDLDETLSYKAHYKERAETAEAKLQDQDASYHAEILGLDAAAQRERARADAAEAKISELAGADCLVIMERKRAESLEAKCAELERGNLRIDMRIAADAYERGVGDCFEYLDKLQTAEVGEGGIFECRTADDILADLRKK